MKFLRWLLTKRLVCLVRGHRPPRERLIDKRGRVATARRECSRCYESVGDGRAVMLLNRAQRRKVEREMRRSR